MRFEAALDEHVAYVARNMRERDATEFLAVSQLPDRQALVNLLLDRYGGYPGAIAASDDKGPVAIGAGIEARPNVVTLMFFATDRFPAAAVPITRFIKNELFPQYRKVGVHRIEAISIESHVDSHRWLELLGLGREATHRGYGRGGETFHQFAWVQDDARSPGA